MRSDEYPRPVSDPEGEGLPDTADDDSTAYDDVRTGRQADGPNPAALPTDHPVGADWYGTTAEEQAHGASLTERLSWEVPDVEPGGDPAPRAPGAADVMPATATATGGPDAGPTVDPVLDDWSQTSEDTVGDRREGPESGRRLADDVTEPGPRADPASQVSMYDGADLGVDAGEQVGRIVAPDEGTHADREPDAVATDAGAAGGGASAEELAMHEIPPPE